MDVTTNTFEVHVINESMKRPVLVDFWAPWCGPCRVLSPILEKLEEEYRGQFMLAKINTEAESALGQAFNIRSIPDVRLFKDGKSIDGFMGALPIEKIREFLDQHIVSEEYQKIIELSQTAPIEAQALFDKAALHGKKREEAAWALVSGLFQSTAPDAARILSVMGTIADYGSVYSDRKAAALYYLDQSTQINDAKILFSGQDDKISAYFDALLQKIENSKDKTREKELMIKAFQLLGNEHPLTNDYRRKLSRILY